MLLIKWPHDTQHNDIQHNDTQHDETQHIGRVLKYCYAECHLCSVSLMLRVTNKPFMLSVIMLNVVLLSAVTMKWHSAKAFPSQLKYQLKCV
jgi:hypothetical protein